MKKIRRWKSWAAIVVGFVAVTLGGFRSTAWSEDLPPPSSGDLEQRVRILERKLEVADENATAKASETAKPSADKDGFALKSADGNFALKFHALIQADGRFFIDDKAGTETDQFLLRRVRPWIEGTLYRDFDFRVVPDFAANAATTLFDAYLDIKTFPQAKLRAGKYKPPIGLEHLYSDPDLIFAERAFPSTLVPSRDTGLQLFGDVAGGVISYAAAFTNGVGENNNNTTTTAPVATDTDSNDGKEGTARIAIQPFKNVTAGFWQGLAFGLGGSYARQNTTGPNYRSPGQLVIFTPTATAIPDGEKIRLAPEFVWTYHSIGALAEYVQSSQVYRVGSTRSRVINNAWQLAASYVLTGEDATFYGVRPSKPLDPSKGQWGAFEIAARFHQLYLDPDNFTNGIASASTSIQRATAWAAGLNWYLNKAVRWTTDYEQTTFDKGATVGDRPNEKVVISRLQLNF